MKKYFLALITVCTLAFTIQGQAGTMLRGLDQGIPNPDAQPNSNAFGKSLDGWMETYLRWLEDGADPDARVKNIAFLPILGESPFTVEVEPGTAFVLPIATWIAADGEPALPDEWWGDRDHIFGDVYVDGQPVAVPNAEFYVGPTDLDPSIVLFGSEFDYYQALVVVIKPLTPGEHQIVLHSEFVDLGAVFDNTWIITVTPPGK
jgi:hypothetical protein